MTAVSARCDAMTHARPAAFVPTAALRTPPARTNANASVNRRLVNRRIVNRCIAPANAASKTARSVLVAAAAAALCVVHTQHCLAYGLIQGRLDKCRGDMPCVSTASVANPSKFGAPWTYRPQTDDADVAWQALKTALQTNRDGGHIVESVDGPKLYYLRAEFPSSFRGIDDVEFRLIREEALVTYRSASREAIFLYPLQTPINTDKNRTRLLDIRKALGWDEFAGFNVFGIDQPSL